MKKEKTSIYEAVSLEGDVLKTAIKENALLTNCWGDSPSTPEGPSHGVKGSVPGFTEVISNEAFSQKMI